MPDATPAAAPAIPSITGNPVIDTALKALVMTAGASISTLLIGELSAHGITDASVTSQVPVLVGAVLAGAAALAAAGWAIVTKGKTVNAVIDNAIAAAATGQVPPAVTAMASDAQKIAINVANNTPVPPPLNSSGG